MSKNVIILSFLFLMLILTASCGSSSVLDEKQVRDSILEEQRIKKINETHVTPERARQIIDSVNKSL